MIFKLKIINSEAPANYYFSVCWHNWTTESYSGKLLLVYRQLMLRELIPASFLINGLDIDSDRLPDGTRCWKIYMSGPWRQFACITALNKG